jgi:hypothetical protein
MFNRKTVARTFSVAAILSVLGVSVAAYAIAVGNGGTFIVHSAQTYGQCQNNNNSVHGGVSGDCSITVKNGICNWIPLDAPGEFECRCPAVVTKTDGECQGISFSQFSF